MSDIQKFIDNNLGELCDNLYALSQGAVLDSSSPLASLEKMVYNDTLKAEKLVYMKAVNTIAKEWRMSKINMNEWHI